MLRIIILGLITIFSSLTFAQNAKTCLDFDGTNDYVSLGNNTALMSAKLTVEAWINADTWKASAWQGTIVGKDSWASGQVGYALRAGAGGSLELNLANGSTGAWKTAATSAIMSTAKWYHVVGTYDGDSIRVYINGVLKGVADDGSTVPNIMNSTVNTLIGDCPGQMGSRAFDGKIDEVRIWKIALDAATINSWMYKPLSTSHPKISDLIAYYHFDEGTGTSVNDTSANNFKGTLTNFGTTPWVTSYSPYAYQPSFCLNDLAAVWPSLSSNTSAELSITSSLSGNTYVVFGRCANSLNYNSSDKPSTIQKRLSRFWHLEKEGSTTGTLVFNYSKIDTSGFYTFKLLVDSDTNFSNATIINGSKLGKTKISFSNVSIQDSFFYTIAAYDYQEPTVKTSSIAEKKAFSAKINAEVIEDGGLTTTRGVCWSTTANPTIALTTKTTNGTGAGKYQADITNLTANTSYHVRAYASNSKGTVYGADSSFTTLTASNAQIKTSGLVTIYTDSAFCKGEVVFDGNVAVTERGFCWSNTSNPKASLSTKAKIGTGMGIFTGYLKTLTPGTLYHYRAYCITAIDTFYGGDSTFTTLAVSVPTVITGNITSITGFTAKVAGQISFDGRKPVTEKGICWSTSKNPTVSLSTKTTEGSGNAAFNSSLAGLQHSTTYHVRAYATNSIGTGYGADTFFTTCAPPTVVVDSIKAISYYNADIFSSVVSDGKRTVTARGICYGTALNPDLINASNKPYGSGVGAFLISLNGLTANTTYHVRSYAINDVDTAYSNDHTFKTLKNTAPKITTSTTNNILAFSAKSGGTITDDGGLTISEKGVCWSTTANPTARLSTKVSAGSGKGTFTSNITGLNRGTIYHVRSYAVNAIDTAYGGDTIFSTPGAPEVTTDAVSSINGEDAQCGGTVLKTGGTVVLMRGVIWSTSPNPIATLTSKTTDGFGLGHFNSYISFLTPGTTYYVRAYALNSVDTGYGNEVSFTTKSLPTVTTTAITSITGISAVSGGDVISGDAVTARGIAWSKYPNPTVSLSTKTSNGSGLGTFTSNISGLSPGTTYHVRAYATNSIGTAYGSDIVFVTATKPVVTTSASNVTSSSTADCGGNVSSDGGMTVTQRGVYWSNTKNPDFAAANKTNDGTGTGSFTSSLTGLVANTTYYIYAFAINAVDTAFGQEVNVIITPPTALTDKNSNITINGADLLGIVNAHGISTTLYFEFGKTTSYGSTINGTPANTSGTTDENISAILSGLTHNTLYHYRLVAENTHGKTYGADSTFTTVFDVSIDHDQMFKDVLVFIDNSILVINGLTSESEIRIFNGLGKEVLKGKINNNNYCIELPFSHGIYFVQLLVDGNMITKKMVLK